MAREKSYPSAKLDQYMIRFPEGMRDRIKKAAERHNRSMNAEIIAALNQIYPEEPTIHELLDKVHQAIELASSPSLPYRKTLIAALDELSTRVSSGLDLDHFKPGTENPFFEDFADFGSRYARWKRVSDEGVDQADLERELKKGLLDRMGRERLHNAIMQFKRGVPDKALKTLMLGSTKFAEPEKAAASIERHIRSFYEENWEADPDESWADMVDDDI